MSRNFGHEQLTAMSESLPVNSPAAPGAATILLHSPAMDEQSDYTSKLFFLYNVVADVQGTIRFLDTKAALCATLLTAMTAAAFQFSSGHHRFPHAHLVFLGVYGLMAMVCLSICLRVIFPTVHRQGSFSVAGPAEPAFFLVPKGQRHRLRDTLGNQPPTGLETTHATYLASMMAATDADLVHSMCDEVVTISFLRQVKSDRLHLAIQVLALTVLAFFFQLVV
jgi:hypothetical protein